MHQYSLVAAFRLYSQSPRESQNPVNCQALDFAFECLIWVNSTENQNVLKMSLFTPYLRCLKDSQFLFSRDWKKLCTINWFHTCLFQLTQEDPLFSVLLKPPNFDQTISIFNMPSPIWRCTNECASFASREPWNIYTKWELQKTLMYNRMIQFSSFIHLNVFRKHFMLFGEGRDVIYPICGIWHTHFHITFNLVSYNAISYKEYLSIFHLHDVLCCVAPVQREKKNKDLGKSLTSDKKLINIHF